jgi:2-oxoglutarate dehydrogenase E2 component (dihydrolipoamide succinyltransferase)
MAELESIHGTGNEGRVTKKDILNYVANRSAAPVAPAPVNDTPAATPVAASPAPASSVVASGNVELVEMDRMRIVKWRDANKAKFEKQYGEKITFTPIFIEAIANCIRKYPMINASVDGNTIIIKKDINIGMATALPSGNLIVPVIRNADTKNLLGLSKDVNGLANAARNNKLKADDTQGGTFTMTNVGTFGSLMGTPIINQPQVAILAVGSIKKRPMVLETPAGDVIAIRHMMYLSLSYDHRIVDGSLGASFLTAVANELEAFDIDRSI